VLAMLAMMAMMVMMMWRVLAQMLVAREVALVALASDKQGRTPAYCLGPPGASTRP
jgi:hypothetical protein